MAFRFVLAIALMASVASGDNNDGALPAVGNLPGAHTAAEVLAASSKATSNFLSPNGPVQPAITAAANLPARAGERVNQGMSRASSGLNNQAQAFSRIAGDGGNIRMPGLDLLESGIPQPLSSLGHRVQDAARQQAQAGRNTMNRLGSELQHGGASAQDLMQQSGTELRGQFQKLAQGASGRLNEVRDFGQDLHNQAQGYTRTISNGAQGALGQLQRAGQEVMGQVQNNNMKNRNRLTGMLGSLQSSLQGTMGSMGGNAQKNLDGLVRQAQSGVQQLSSQFQKVAQMPGEIISNLGRMVNSGVSGASGGVRNMATGGRY